jgi:hypothetical protein
LAYREKLGWLSIVAMAITFGPYFLLVAAHAIPAAALPNTRQLVVFGITAGVQGVIILAGNLYFRHQSPDDVQLPPDERDRAISQRALSTAYSALIGGMILVGCMMPFNSSGWSIVNSAVFMIVAAELIRNGVLVASYRRQAA